VEKTTQQGALCSVLLTTFYPGNKFKNNEITQACSTRGERRGAYRVLVGNPEETRQLWTPRRRWEDNIKMNLREVGRLNRVVRIETGGCLL
jgi:hypothetical protein